MNSEIVKLYSLDTGKLGNRAEEWSERINIPYSYLPDFLRGNMPFVMKTFIQPIMQDLSRAGKLPLLMTDQIVREKERLSPEKITSAQYLRENLRMYEAKFNLHYSMQRLLIAKQKGNISSREFVQDGFDLLTVGLRVEPWSFAIGGLAKKYIEKYLALMPQNLSDEENDLLRICAMPSAYVTFELDMREYLASNEEEKKQLKPRLLRRYFNDEELYFSRIVAKMRSSLGRLTNDERLRVLDDIAEIRDMYKSRWVRKVNFLAERKIPYAEDLDGIMMMDNCFDKYFEYKAIFIHDIFLKMAVLDVARRRGFLRLTPDNLGERMREALYIGDEELNMAVG